MKTILAVLTFFFSFIQVYSQSWSGLGNGLNHETFVISEYNNQLITGGTFDTAGGVQARRIAKWDGSNWSSLGTGMSGGLLGIGTVRALTVFNGELIAGGYFTNAGGNTVNFIARWNGSAWSSLGTGMSGTAPYVEALAVYNGQLIVGGTFDSAGGIPCAGIARWNGTSWTPFGSGLSPNFGVYTLFVYNNNLIAGGAFNSVNGVSALNIASYNGTTWSSLGSGVKGVLVKSLGTFQNNLIVGGRFDTAGSVYAKNIALWNGSAWSAMSSGMNNDVYAVLTYAGELIAGGYFTVAGGTAANYIARWNGSTWLKLGPGTFNGTNNYVTALYLFPQTNPALFVGGYFTSAGNFPASRIARWGLINAVNNNNQSPSEFKLYQNYPNPFNPSTKIKFDVAKSANVKLLVYDELGRTVSVIFDETLTPGSYEADWDASNLSSGTYYYDLRTEGFTQTKKMIIQK